MNEILMGIEVALVCSNDKCENTINLTGSTPVPQDGYIKLERNLRYICCTCGKDMSVRVEKITHLESVETVG